MQKKWIVLAICLLILGIALAIVVFQNGEDMPPEEENLEEQRIRASAHVLRPGERAQEIAALDKEAAAESLKISQSMTEEQAIESAKAKLRKGDQAGYEALRDEWRGRDTLKSDWFVLDADLEVMKGHKAEAEMLLKSEEFPDKEDSKRLLRLTLLEAKGGNGTEYFLKLREKDPDNRKLAVLEGYLLEKQGRLMEARQKFLAAIQAEPTNIWLQDQLAGFYQRNGQYEAALLTWVKALKAEDYWIKAWFWSHVAVALPSVDFKKLPLNGPLRDYVLYLSGLKQGEFWNEAQFKGIQGHEALLTSRQETLWLRLLDRIAKGDQKAALHLLDENPFYAHSWFPLLEEALAKTLNERLNGSFIGVKETGVGLLSREYIPSFFGAGPDHPFFEAVAHSQLFGSLSQEDQSLIEGPLAYSALLLGAGWKKAASAIYQEGTRGKLPQWMALELAKAIRDDRGNQAALQFASSLEGDSALTLFVGELYLSQGKVEEALEQLMKIAEEDSLNGYRAAWLASRLQLDSGRVEEAEKTVLANPRLSQDTNLAEISSQK